MKLSACGRNVKWKLESKHDQNILQRSSLKKNEKNQIKTRCTLVPKAF